METIFTFVYRIAFASDFLLIFLLGCLIYSSQHIINKLDFDLLVNLNIISKYSKMSTGRPKSDSRQAGQFQTRVPAIEEQKIAPSTFKDLTIYIALLPCQETIKQSNCINFQQLICLTLVWDHNNLVKPKQSAAISRHVDLHLFKKRYLSLYNYLLS